MTWFNIEADFVRNNAYGYAIYAPESGFWRFVDDGDIINEIDWTVGLCGYIPCLKYAILVTSNTKAVLDEHGYVHDGSAIPYARFNNGLFPGTTTSSSTWGWRDWIIVVFSFFTLWFLFRKRK